HTIFSRDWSSDVCSSDLIDPRTEQPLRTLYLLAPSPEESEPAYRAAATAAEAIRRIGIPLEVEALPWTVLRERIGKGEFDAYARSEERRVGKEWRSRGSQ